MLSALRHVQLNPDRIPNLSKHCQHSSAQHGPLLWQQRIVFNYWANWSPSAQVRASAAFQPSSETLEQHRKLASLAELPLAGKRVMITAPRQYAQKLVSKLLEAGARPIWLPSVQVSVLHNEEQYAELDRALQQLSMYSHVAFTSRNGVEAFMMRLAKACGGVLPAAATLKSSGTKLCALGADASALEQYGVTADVIPQEASTLGLVQELVRRGEAAGASILCPVPLVEGGLVEPAVVPRFLEALRAAGASPRRAAAYSTAPGSWPEGCAAEAALLREGHIHAIALSSTAEAQGLLLLLGGADAVREAVTRHNVLLAAHGPYTAAGAGAVMGMPITCVSQDFSSFDGLVSALEAALTHKT